MPTISGIGLAVQSGLADQGVLAIENSLEGAVPETLDLLIHTPKPMFIRNEIVRTIEMYLLAKPGVGAADIKVIRSIPIAVAQCRGFIERCFPKAEIEAALSTPAAVGDGQSRSGAPPSPNR